MKILEIIGRGRGARPPGPLFLRPCTLRLVGNEQTEDKHRGKALAKSKDQNSTEESFQWPPPKKIQARTEVNRKIWLKAEREIFSLILDESLSSSITT